MGLGAANCHSGNNLWPTLSVCQQCAKHFTRLMALNPYTVRQCELEHIGLQITRCLVNLGCALEVTSSGLGQRLSDTLENWVLSLFLFSNLRCVGILSPSSLLHGLSDGCPHLMIASLYSASQAGRKRREKGFLFSCLFCLKRISSHNNPTPSRLLFISPWP